MVLLSEPRAGRPAPKKPAGNGLFPAFTADRGRGEWSLRLAHDGRILAATPPSRNKSSVTLSSHSDGQKATHPPPTRGAVLRGESPTGGGGGDPPTLRSRFFLRYGVKSRRDRASGFSRSHEEHGGSHRSRKVAFPSRPSPRRSAAKADSGEKAARRPNPDHAKRRTPLRHSPQVTCHLPVSPPSLSLTPALVCAGAPADGRGFPVLPSAPPRAANRRKFVGYSSSRPAA
jgi:hypothetical protein